MTKSSDKLGIDPLAAAKGKMKINGRKYPIEFTKGNVLKCKGG